MKSGASKEEAAAAAAKAAADTGAVTAEQAQKAVQDKLKK
jgi:hypothetical protein